MQHEINTPEAAPDTRPRPLGEFDEGTKITLAARVLRVVDDGDSTEVVFSSSGGPSKVAWLPSYTVPTSPGEPEGGYYVATDTPPIRDVVGAEVRLWAIVLRWSGEFVEVAFYTPGGHGSVGIWLPDYIEAVV